MEHIAGYKAAWQQTLPGTHRHEVDPAVQFIAFEVEAFDALAYQAAGLVCPQGIARSVKKRQAEFLFGRLAARQAMRAMGVPVVDVTIGIHREPVWPFGLIGSISHCDGLAAAVVLPRGSRCGVGIDMEAVVADTLHGTLRATVLDTAEWGQLERLAADALPLNLLLTIAFSAKESLFKAAFGAVGRFFGFEAARLREMDLQGQQLVLEIQEDLCASLPRGQLCTLHYGMLPAGHVFTSWLW
jgi:4'-phosphopantetheinyl transferase EntD